MRNLIRSLAGTLERVIGIDEAEGYISVVGAQIGEEIDKQYKTALSIDKLNTRQVSDALVDLKRRIDGDFYIIEEREDRIVLGNRKCPFGEAVSDRPSLCMMTSNVFGFIAAENLGYARVDVQKAIARGDPGCRIVIYLKPTEDTGDGEREYFGSDS
ncbi:MAG: methanogen output domain 1-containing protein [Alphaproteobacteria bacterium]